LKRERGKTTPPLLVGMEPTWLKGGVGEREKNKETEPQAKGRAPLRGNLSVKRYPGNRGKGGRVGVV